MKLLAQSWKISSRLLSHPRALEGTICASVNPQGIAFCGARVGATGHRDVSFVSSRCFGIPILGISPPLRATLVRSSWLGSGAEAFSRRDFEMAPDVLTPSESNDMLRGFQIVVAATSKMGIGKQGQLPWKLPTDMKFFKTVTATTSSPAKKNAVIMGRLTWESIPEKFRPLPGRLNVVLTRSGIKRTPEGVVVSGSLDAALALLASPPYSSEVETVFVIGGGQVFKYATLLQNLDQFLNLLLQLHPSNGGELPY